MGSGGALLYISPSRAQGGATAEIMHLKHCHSIGVSRCVVGSLMAALLLLSLILTVKQCENRSIFDEVKIYQTKCASFFGHPVCGLVDESIV